VQAEAEHLARKLGGYVSPGMTVRSGHEILFSGTICDWESRKTIERFRFTRDRRDGVVCARPEWASQQMRILMATADEALARMDSDPAIELEPETAHVYVEKLANLGIGALIARGDALLKGLYCVHVDVFGLREGRLPALVRGSVTGAKYQIYEGLRYHIQVLRDRARGYSKYDVISLGHLGSAEDEESLRQLRREAEEVYGDESFQARRRALLDD